MRLIVFIAFLLSAAAVVAEPPPTILSWVTPTGTVEPDESIGVWLRLTVDPGAEEALVLDGSTANFDPATEFPEFQSVTEVQTSNSLACNNTFIPGDRNELTAAYAVEWNFGADAFMPQNGGTLQPLNMTLQPGQSHDFLIAIFRPRNGPAPEGKYTLTTAGPAPLAARLRRRRPPDRASCRPGLRLCRQHDLRALRTPGQRGARAGDPAADAGGVRGGGGAVVAAGAARGGGQRLTPGPRHGIAAAAAFADAAPGVHAGGGDQGAHTWSARPA